MSSIPGVRGSRRIADEVNKSTGEMKTIPARPWDKEFVERVTNTQNTFTTALSDIRYRIGGLTRQLLAQGKHLTMSQEEYAQVTQSIEALSQAFVAVCTVVENLRKVACSDVWVSTDVEKVAKDLAALVHAAADLDAFRQLPDGTVPKTTKVMNDCSNVLRKGADVLGLVREVSGIELGVNNLGMTAEDFRRLAGVGAEVQNRVERTDLTHLEPKDLLPRAIRNPEPMTKEELASVEELRAKARGEYLPPLEGKPLGVGPVDDLKLGPEFAPTPVHVHPNPDDVRKAMLSSVEEKRVEDVARLIRDELSDGELRVCERCGLDDPPRGRDILPVVEKRASGKKLCVTCWEIERNQARTSPVRTTREVLDELGDLAPVAKRDDDN